MSPLSNFNRWHYLCSIAELSATLAQINDGTLPADGRTKDETPDFWRAWALGSLIAQAEMMLSSSAALIADLDARIAALEATDRMDAALSAGEL